MLQFCLYIHLKGLIANAENKLKALSEDMSRIRFTIADQFFQPEAVNVHEQNSSCPRPGQAYVERTSSKEAHCGTLGIVLYIRTVIQSFSICFPNFRDCLHAVKIISTIQKGLRNFMCPKDVKRQ